jgi:hypothetical protein
MLVPPFGPHPEWAESLTESLLQPEFLISMWEAFGRRFRRNYLWIFLILTAAWMLKSFPHPGPAASWQEFIARSAIGPVPGEAMLIVGLLYNGLLFVIGFGTAGLTQASGEVLSKFGEIPVLSGLWRAMEAHEHSTHHGVSAEVSEAKMRGASAGARPNRPWRRRPQLLALIVTEHPQAIADHVLTDLRRGATALHGRGMYTQQERDVLMVAVTVTEMAQLKSLVKLHDPNAFVIVAPAQEVLGRGFKSLGA